MARCKLFRLQTRDNLGSSGMCQRLNDDGSARIDQKMPKICKQFEYCNKKSRELNPILDSFYQHDPPNHYSTIQLALHITPPCLVYRFGVILSGLSNTLQGYIAFGKSIIRGPTVMRKQSARRRRRNRTSALRSALIDLNISMPT